MRPHRALSAAVLLALCVSAAVGDAPSSKSRRSPGNVDVVPSISRSLPSSRSFQQFPSHYFNGNTPALITRHRPGPRRLAHGKPPPYAVQMEPLVQYSQRDPLYQEAVADLEKKYSVGPGPSYQHFPQQQQQQHHHQHHHHQQHQQQQHKYVYLKEPEPIIEIIVQESNDTLPTPAPIHIGGAPGAKAREPVEVFYVKYKKDEHSDGVVYEKPVPAVTPAAPLDHVAEESPAPSYGPPAGLSATTPPPAPSTTLRSIIHPDSEKVHVSTGGLKITFGANKDVEPTYKTKRQQPRLNSAAFPSPSHSSQFIGSQPDFTQSNRFLAPPPLLQTSRNSPPPSFFSSNGFARQNLPQFTGKLDQFQQSPLSYSGGKLEPVPFKQPSTGKIEFFDGQTLRQFNSPPQSQFRLQEPVNGLPPPPPPFQFQRPSFQAPSFTSPAFRNPRPQARPFLQPQFSHPALQSPLSTQFPSRLPQPAPFSPLPPVVVAPFPQQAPQIPFKPLPTQFSLPATTTPAPQTTYTTTTAAPPPSASSFTQGPSFGHEIVKSLSPSSDELREQQQEQFRREQEYFLEVQKYQKELELRQKESATAKPTPSAHFPSTSTTARRPVQNHQQFFQSTSTAAPTTTTEAPNKVPSNVILPDEVPDDLRQQLLSSGILSNADIQILDYDKVGDIPVESLPPEALSQFLGATKGSVPSGSAPVPQIVAAPSHRKSDNEDSIAEPSDIGANNVPGPVELKVVRYPPGAEEEVSNQYVQSGAHTLDPVQLNDNRYNRYLPLQVAGSSFPIPNARILEGRNITSVVVLAPVVQPVQQFARRSGHVIETEETVEFVAGETLTELVQKPSQSNFKRFIDKERKTPSNKQSVILLVTERANSEGREGAKKEIFMFDVNTQQVSKLKGELSSAFVEVALANSGNQEPPAPSDNGNKLEATTSTTTAPPKKVETVSISSGYSKTKQ